MSHTNHHVPTIVIGRLPLYLRALTQLAVEGRRVTSSQELSEKLGFSSAQIRKDLSYFGEFGKQGTGYEIEFLENALREILQVDRVWNMALVGAGDLGHALANYDGFELRGFRITAIFDSAPAKIGAMLGNWRVLPMDTLRETVRAQKIYLAIIAVPAAAAQAVADELVQGGVRAILNYAPTTLSVPPQIKVFHIDPVAGLQSMTYYL
ncbi:MAG: Redox-sensing transcriptional repressor Rex [Anaerolineae bacterium]|nr:Redox-sensing transcriptional repressor Rex [Anaerolineae bacterium]MDL1898191.1 redox-sensing transcriptional repressor Rex [Anaerolineae bacterium CFX7]RIK29468.1 MAG: redox-sensing transcriptional repressor Rex [Chloroflexota bacterium]